MAMCIIMLSASYMYPTNLSIVSTASYPLLLYCILDIAGNSWDMVIHHISTIIVCLTLHNTYSLQEITTTLEVTNNLMFTEVSTIFLNFIHLGYKHLLIKLGFLLTFTYFRVIKLPWIFIFNEETCYFCVDRKSYVCGSSDLCHFMWRTSIITLMLLNSMWFCKIIRKILKKNYPKPTIKG